MEKGKVKNSGIVSFNLKNLISLTAVVCVLSFIAGAAYTESRSPITLMNPTETKTQGNNKPLLYETDIKTSPAADFENSGVDEPRLQIKTTTIRDEQDTHQKQPEKWQSIRMRVTAYCPCPKCCGEYSDGITACGHKIKPGDTFVAADNRFAFDTEMIIAGYNNGQPVKVLDRGGAIRGNRLDAFFQTHEEALEWGVRYIDVKVLSR